jgi:hypothetical protein
MLEGGIIISKINHVYVADVMLEGDFVVPKQVMFVPRMECYKVVLYYQNKPYLKVVLWAEC